MPHLILEYSGNIEVKSDFSDLFKKCHQLLVELLPTELSTCKSRAIKFDNFYDGNGESKNAFIYVNLKIFPGREIEKLKVLNEKLLDVIKEHFCGFSKLLKLDISIEISELSEIYLKSNN